MEVKLIRHQQELSDVVSFFFAKPAGFSHEAGDYTELELQTEGFAGRRWFTIASAPHEEHLQFTTKFPPRPSKYKQHLLALKPGESAYVSPAIGNFNLPLKQDKLLFIAAGIGITPFVAMQKHLLHRNITHDLTLIHLARDQHLFKNWFEDGSADTWFLRSNEDRLSYERVTQLVSDTPEHIVYLAGPEALMEKLHGEFLRNQHPRPRLKLEYFPGHQKL